MAPFRHPHVSHIEYKTSLEHSDTPWDPLCETLTASDGIKEKVRSENTYIFNPMVVLYTLHTFMSHLEFKTHLRPAAEAKSAPDVSTDFSFINNVNNTQVWSDRLNSEIRFFLSFHYRPPPLNNFLLSLSLS